jgi:chromate reductase, NAD(P)H dehydrogenase (quinone)
MRILGIPGSLRAGSLNEQLLRLTAEELPEGVELELYGDLAEIPPYDQDLDHLQPDAVQRLKTSIAEADALLVATPEFNGSIPGQLKNAFDWVSRPRDESPIRSKPVAVIGASTSSFGGIWAQRELKKVLGIMGARVLEVELPVGKADRRLVDPDPALRLELGGILQAILDAVPGVEAPADAATPAASAALASLAA